MMSREHIGTIILAAVFAVLIWLWAEGENREQASASAEISFVSSVSSRNYLIRARDPDTRELVNHLQVNLELQGPNQAVQFATNALETLRLEFDDTTDGAEVVVDLVEALQRLPVFDAEGISVLSVTPAQLTVRVDQLIDIVVPITPSAPGYDFETLIFDPAEVTVRIPNETWLIVETQFGKEFVYADLPTTRLQSLRPGESSRFTQVPLRLHDGLTTLDWVLIEPSFVTAEVTLATRVATIEMSVSVKLSFLPSDSALYDVQVAVDDRFIRDVILSGDADVIERIRSGDKDAKVKADLDLTSDDLEQRIKEKQIEWVLPAGVTARIKGRPPQERPIIPITIRKRSEDPPA